MDQPKPFTGEELRAFLSGGASAEKKPTAPSEPAAGSMTGAELRNIITQDAESRRPKVGAGEDIARAAGSGLSRGAIGLIGLPGDIESLGRMGLRAAGANVSPEPALPTSQGVISKVSELSPAVKKALEYQPEYAPGRYTKTISEFLPSIIGGPGSIGARVAGTVGAGIASQGAEDILKNTSMQGTGYETALKIAASIPGYFAGTKAAGLAHMPFAGAVTPTREAEKRLVTEMAKDISSGGPYGAKATPGQLSEVAGEVPLAAAAGKRTQDLIQRSSEQVPEAVQGAFSDKVRDLQGSAPNIVTKQIDDFFGGAPVKPFDEIAEISRQASQINKPAYKTLYALPHAQAITSPELVQVVRQLPRGMLDDVGELLRQQGVDPRSMGMVTGRGGQYTINPSQPMPIQFWDTLKRQLDVAASKTKDPMTGKILDPGLHSATTGTVDKLKSAINPIVPEYAEVRGAAAEILGAKNAVDLGTKFMNLTKPIEIDQVYRKVINNPSVSDDIKRDFAYGVAGAYRQRLEDAPETALKFFTGKDAPKRIRMMSDALSPIGPEAGQQLVGQVISQNLNNSIQALKPGTSSVGKLIPYAGTGAAAAVLQIGEILAQPLVWAGTPGAIATVLATAAGGKLFNMKEARVAQKVLELSIDPSKTQQLVALAAQDPNARSFIQKMSDLAQRYGRISAGATIGTEPREPEARPQRASGGRIAHESMADSLVRAAEVAKNNIGKQTETILNKPDETVVRALKIANENLEG